MRFEKCDLDKTKLRTRRHVVEYLLFLRSEGISNVRKNVKLDAYANYVAREIIELWKCTGIPLLGIQRVRKLIIFTINSYKKLMNHPRKYVEKKWKNLFMICRCNCFVNSITGNCKCPSMSAIPASAKVFFF